MAEVELAQQRQFVQADIGRVKIEMGTDREGRYITIDIGLYDADGWCIETKLVTLPLSELLQ